MALRRDLDDYAGYTFEEMVETIVELKEQVDDLLELMVDMQDKLDERDLFIKGVFEAGL